MNERRCELVNLSCSTFFFFKGSPCHRARQHSLRKSPVLPGKKSKQRGREETTNISGICLFHCLYGYRALLAFPRCLHCSFPRFREPERRALEIILQSCFLKLLSFYVGAGCSRFGGDKGNRRQGINPEPRTRCEIYAACFMQAVLIGT